VDFSLTYSCYKGEKKHCGKCGTCVERKEALAGFDPTVYEE
jgi:7-cyano-7-deazaguanine synthase